MDEQQTAPADTAPTSTSFTTLLPDLNGGVFEEALERALSDVALGVVLNNRAGSVTINFGFKRIGDSNQVACTHTLSYKKPTKRGKATEDYSTETPLYVGRGGRLTIMPDAQTAFEFDDARRERMTP